jgi:hypothetical protein
MRSPLTTTTNLRNAARARIGARLQFAVNFAEDNLDHYREREWNKLRTDLETFLYGLTGQPIPTFGAITIRAMDPPFPSDYPKDAFRELQAEVRHLLRGIAPTAQTPDRDLSGGPSFTIKQNWSPMRLGSAIVLNASGSVREGFLFLLVLLLAQHGLQNVRRCPSLECGRLFWKVRRQLYCSRTCVNRENQRAWTRKKRRLEPSSAKSRQRAKKGGRK